MTATIAVALFALTLGIAGVWLSLTASWQGDPRQERRRLARQDHAKMASTFTTVRRVANDPVVTHAEVVCWLPESIRGDFQAPSPLAGVGVSFAEIERALRNQQRGCA